MNIESKQIMSITSFIELVALANKLIKEGYKVALIMTEKFARMIEFAIPVMQNLRQSIKSLAEFLEEQNQLLDKSEGLIGTIEIILKYGPAQEKIVAKEFGRLSSEINDESKREAMELNSFLSNGIDHKEETTTDKQESTEMQDIKKKVSIVKAEAVKDAPATNEFITEE